VLTKMNSASVRVKFILVKELDQIMVKKLILSKFYSHSQDYIRILLVEVQVMLLLAQAPNSIPIRVLVEIGLT